MQGEDYFQDGELELWKVESNIATIKKEMCEVENKKETVHTQFQEMEKGGGISLWPKPFLHPKCISIIFKSQCSHFGHWFFIL